MGTVSARRADGSTFEVRTTAKTRHIRIAHEQPVHVDLSKIGNTPLLEDLFLSTSSVLDDLDLSPLAGHPKLTSLTATTAKPISLAPLATTKIESLSFDLHGPKVLDFRPIHGLKSVRDLDLAFSGSQAKLDLQFVRKLPSLETLSIDGGNWKKLDLSPLAGLPLVSFTLTRQYVSKIDLSLLAQPALEHLTLADLDVREQWLSLAPLAQCKALRSLSLSGNEIRTLDVTAIAKLPSLDQFEPPNGMMTMRPDALPIAARGLRRWADSIGVE